MKRVEFIWLTVFCLALGTLHAQPYGNEWINYSQRYFKFPVVEEGIYRINAQTLQAAGVPVTAIDPRNLQLFARETEVPIFVSGEEDGVFNQTDFIEFYARGNDGWLDQKLFTLPEQQLNPDYSYYNDTIHYFLTWNAETTNLRVTQETDVNTGAYPEAEWVWQKLRVNYNNNYYGGQLDPFGGSLPTFSIAEGWMSARFGYPSGSLFRETTFALTGLYTATGAPQIELQAVSASTNNPPGSPNHLLRISVNGNLVTERQFSGYQTETFSHTLSASSIPASGNLVLRHEIPAQWGPAADYQAVAWAQTWYPRSVASAPTDGWSFAVPLNEQSNKTTVPLPADYSANAVCYQLGQTVRRLPIVPGQVPRVLVPNTLEGDRFACYVATAETIRQVASLAPVANNGFFTNYTQAALDSAFVIITHRSLLEAAVAYSNYRQQRFSTVVCDIDELYDQFGGGIEKHALSIRRFADLMLDQWPSAPSAMLLIGKGVREANDLVPTPGQPAQGARLVPAYYAQNLVPAFGYPSSDIALTAGLNATTLQPAIPTGRLSVTSPQEVYDYLAKLQVFESQPHAEWMKHALHFGGGNTLNEQNNFAYYLSTYEQTLEDTLFGGEVKTIRKNSSAPVQLNVSQEIEERINEGVSLMTFFGHASGEGFDQNIDNPVNFDWNGRHPLLIGNGCYSGDIFQPGQNSTSENFTLLPGKGVIGFLAQVKLGFEPFLDDYTSELYRQMSFKNYGTSIGYQVQKTIENIQFSQGPNPNIYLTNQCLGMTLHGDPAVVINQWPYPDLAISEDRIFFEPEEITAQIDSFSVHVVVTNLAKATTEPVTLTIEHRWPGATADSVYTQVLDGLLFKDTVEFKLPVNLQTGLGLHQFNVFVDLPQNQIEEMPGWETANNQVLGKQLFIGNGGIVPVYPYNEAVIGDANDLRLRASTGDPFAPLTTYVLQVDTTNTFNSPSAVTLTTQATGGVIEWNFPLFVQDSAVYFWRTSPDSIPGEGYTWRTSSFQYIQGKNGWGQAHPYQLETNNLSQLELNKPERRLDFATGTVQVRTDLVGNSLSNSNQVKLNTELAEYGGCGAAPSLHLMVFDPVTLKPWGTAYNGQNEQNNLGNANNNGSCRPRVENYFIYRQNNATQLQALADVLTDGTIPAGHYVLLYTWRYATYSTWEAVPDLADAFANLGAAQVATGQDSVPFIFMARLGDPAFVFEAYGDTINSALSLAVDLPASGFRGAMVSQLIGPAKAWETLSWQFAGDEFNAYDSLKLEIRAVRADGSEMMLNGLQSFELANTEVDLQPWVDAAEFPYLRLQAGLSDTEQATPPVHKRWHVLYEPVPEAALDARSGYAFEHPEVQEGEAVRLAVAVRNVSPYPMDSLLVQYWLEGGATGRTYVEYPRQDSLRVGELLVDTVEVDTRGRVGSNRLWIEVNPPDETGRHDQPEQYHFNNIAAIPFQVVADDENPLLDVTFDGIHIMNGEIVSARPYVLVTLKDENPFLLADSPADTALFQLFLSTPEGNQQRLFFMPTSGESEVEFIPANGNNKCKIIYTPQYEVDGKYRLLVQARDKSGNVSGQQDYEIEYEVITESTLTHVLNYPNPFSTSTRFVFTLTGSELPTQFRIQIMTVSGRVVREIDETELGPLRIGRNITEYAWDGTDQFGDRLANGVYLYRILARMNGEAIKLRESGADAYFTKGVGKMYLMR